MKKKKCAIFSVFDGKVVYYIIENIINNLCQ